MPFELEGELPASTCLIAQDCNVFYHEYNEEIPVENSPRWVRLRIAWDSSGPGNEKLRIAIGVTPIFGFYDDIREAASAEGTSPLDVEANWTNLRNEILLTIDHVCEPNIERRACALAAQPFRVNGTYTTLRRA